MGTAVMVTSAQRGQAGRHPRGEGGLAGAALSRLIFNHHHGQQSLDIMVAGKVL